MILETENIIVYRVGELPGSMERVDVETEGRIVADLFRSNPSLPGVILCRGNHVTAGLSQQEFLRHISRPFGMEVYLPRQIGLLLEHARLETLRLPSDLTIEEAVGQCLARPAERLYDPVLVVDQEDEMSAKLVDCQTLFLAVSSTASLRATQMGRILEAVPIGLMLFDRHGRISPEHSTVLPSIFERDSLIGMTVTELLEPILPPSLLLKVHDYLSVLFNGRLIDRLIKSINPVAEFSAMIPGPTGMQRKFLAITFERVRIGQEIAFILAMVEDRTRRVLMDEEKRQREDSAERRLKLVVQMMALDRKELNEFLTKFERLGNRACAFGEVARLGDPGTRDAALEVFRSAHALKGEAGMLGLEGFRELLHDFEEPLRRALKSENFALDGRSVETGAERLRQTLAQAQEGVVMLRRMTREPKKLGSSTDNGNAAAGVPRSTAEDGLSGLLRATERLVGELCTKYGKQARFILQAAPDDIPENHLVLLRQILQQLVRNSLIHGIEPPSLRVAEGKPAVASIQFAARPRGRLVEYVIQDDGRGVDVEALAARAGVSPRLERGEIIPLIFEPGISTADKDGLDAGRGIGLDMVRAMVEEVGGTIAVHDKPGAFCAFQILLPRERPVFS
jgi:signal transduction histidine kinase